MINVSGMVPLLSVYDMPASVAFYCDILGFTISQNDGHPAPECEWLMLRLDAVELMLNTAFERSRRPAQPDSGRLKAHKDVCLYFGCPDVDAAYKHLLAHGVSVKPPRVAHYGMRQLYVADPDGYLLCFQWTTQ